MKRMKNIVLIGFMGTGKTCVGQHLAQAMGWAFRDLDDEVEQAVGMSITDYFSRYGENGFRDREQEAVERVAGMSPLVVATGGGAVLRQINIDRLRETGILVCLSASVEEIVARTAAGTLRPLLNRPDRVQAIQALLTERMSLYRQADIWVETDGKSAAEVAGLILRRLREEGRWNGNDTRESGCEEL